MLRSGAMCSTFFDVLCHGENRSVRCELQWRHFLNGEAAPAAAATEGEKPQKCDQVNPRRRKSGESVEEKEKSGKNEEEREREREKDDMKRQAHFL